MPFMNLYNLTKAGITQYQAELTELLARRPAVMERVKAARETSFADEDGEHAAAYQELDALESRIAAIENILHHAKLIPAARGAKKIQLGSTVKLQDGKRTHQFCVVGTAEADPRHGKISDESPIGRALLNKQKGDQVTVQTPTKAISYVIVAVM